jgi:hypothetical protein
MRHAAAKYSLLKLLNCLIISISLRNAAQQKANPSIRLAQDFGPTMDEIEKFALLRKTGARLTITTHRNINHRPGF